MQSSQSRLKCRKVLGMGESVDGQFHRSKITQLLGRDSMTSWHMSKDEYPLGLRLLQWIMCILFTTMGIAGFVFPNSVHSCFLSKQNMNEIDDLINSFNDATNGKLLHHIATLKAMADAEARLFGGIVLTIAVYNVIVLFWNNHSRRTIRISLIINVVYIFFHLMVSVVSASSTATYSGWFYSVLSIQNVASSFLLIMSAYYYHVTSRDRNFNKFRRNTMEYSE